MSKHTLTTTVELPNGGEVDVEIKFSYSKGGEATLDCPAWEPEVEYIGVKQIGPGRLVSAATLEVPAEAWFNTQDGREAALEAVACDDDWAREQAAEMKREMRYESGW